MNFLDRLFGRPYDENGEAGSTFLVAGLGNPGREYVDNRHNIGFMAVDRLAAAWSIGVGRVKNKAFIGDGRLGEHRIVLVKPQTFMNKSGEAIGQLARFYKIEPAQVLVIYDELDLPFGTLRLRERGSAGGHNGMKSVIRHLGPEFPRLRLGIGRPPGRMPPSAYVLQDFKEAEIAVVREMLDQSVSAVEVFVREGIQSAMSRFNGSVLEN